MMPRLVEGLAAEGWGTAKYFGGSYSIVPNAVETHVLVQLTHGQSGEQIRLACTVEEAEQMAKDLAQAIAAVVRAQSSDPNLGA
jgi:hypothetical protein